MRLALSVIVAALFAGAAAAAAPRSVTVSHPVAAVAADGGFVAFAAVGGARTCERGYVWRAAPSRLTALGRERFCEITSTGRGVGGVAVAGSRVLWVTYAGGNTREWTLWTATASRPAPRQLRFVAVDVEDAQPVLVGRGDGDLLPYALRDTVTVLHASGARVFQWKAPARVTALAANAGRVAVAYTGGKVAILSADGRVSRIESFASDVGAVGLSGDTLVAQRGRALDVRSPSSSASAAFAVAMRLDDVDSGRAVVTTRTQVSVLRLADLTVSSRFAGAHAALEGRRLYVSVGRKVVEHSL